MFIFSKGKPKSINLIKDRKNKWTKPWGKQTRRQKNGELIEKETPKDFEEFGYRFNIWEYNVGKGFSTKDKIAFKHPATFPEKLAEDHIISWSNEGDIVLDPMCGSGTTLKMALKNNRRFLGIEISKEYYDIAKERIDKWYNRNVAEN
jgi:site-specific DNA-methyltransferase (adenine-specific)